MIFKNIYWAYGDKIQQVVNKLLHGKDTWTLHVKKCADGDYTFSVPWAGVFKESLTGGTEEVIDYHAAKLLGKAVAPGQQLTIVVSTKPIDNATTTLVWQQPDDYWPESNWYSDTVASKEAGQPMWSWLCPMLQPMFSGEVPKTIWVSVKLPKWNWDKLKYIVLPYENPEHPLYATKAATAEDEYEDWGV